MVHHHQILTESLKKILGEAFVWGGRKLSLTRFPAFLQDIWFSHFLSDFCAFFSFLSFFKNNSTTVIIFIIFNHLTKCAEWRSHMTSCLKLIWPSEVMALTNFYWQVSWLYYSGDSLFLFLKGRVNERVSVSKDQRKGKNGEVIPTDL